MFERLAEIARLGRFLASCDVIDINVDSGYKLEVYVAMNNHQQTQGLAGLPNIDVDGMLFCFPEPTYIPFTMKDMLFDLDVAWYDKAGKMIQHGSYPAGQQEKVYCSQSYSYVLEVPAGTLPISDLSLGG